MSGSYNGQFKYPSQLTTDSIGRVFIADTDNQRICMHDPDLNHLRNITHQSMSSPSDVKISRDRLYILGPYDYLSIVVLSLEGDELHSIIKCGEGVDVVSDTVFFCLDPLNNFVICDEVSDSFSVFSPEGNLLHRIGGKGQDMFYAPAGVAITPNGRLVCALRHSNVSCSLQIFY